MRRFALLALALAMVASRASAQDDDALAHLATAASVQAATRARLGVLGDAFTCPDARFISYRRSSAEPEVTDQWYVASQLWADAALLESLAPVQPQLDQSALSLPNWDPNDTRCYIDKGFVFLDRLWDYTSAGYFPRSNPVGTSVDNTMRFTDDNLIAGLALLETARTTTDPLAIRRYIHAAQREADFLTQPGTSLWDDTFGGGFWWTTGRGDTEEGKPAQTNALAGLFFAELYDATGDPGYHDWSLRSLLWLDTILWDPNRQLYRWSVSYADIPHKTGATVHARYFNYDQGIAIEAQLRAQRLDGDPNRLARAQAIGRAIQDAFWSPNLGGYNLEAGVEQVYTSYGAWTSLGHLALYAQTGASSWLDLARQNAGALADHLRESDGGYAFRTYRCVNRTATGCEAGPPTIVVDRTRDASAQAWVEHLETAFGDAMLGGGDQGLPH
jgi:hypothetical protein